MGSYWIDLLVLLAYFGVVMGIGLSQRSKSGSVEGFALGDRQTPWWAVLASILAAEISAATFLGAPGEGYAKQNWTYAQLAVGTILARVIVSYLFIPLYYKQGVVSIYEFLGQRFGQRSRRLASATFLVTRVLAMGTRLYVSAIILVLGVELFLGRGVSPMEEFWLYTAAVVMVTVLTAIYTAVGGIRAVIWTDFIQVGVLVVALAFTIPFLLSKVPGGWSTVAANLNPPVVPMQAGEGAFTWFKRVLPVVFDTVPSHAGEGTFAWLKRVLTNEYTVYSAIIGSTFVTMATHGIDQDTVQRMLTAKNRRQSAFATILSGIIDLPVVSAFVFIGILLHIFYTANPVPGLPTEDREVFPFFILHAMSPGLRGLVAAAILATAMGSLSTALNAMATSFSQDFVLPRIERKRPGSMDDAARVRVMRRSTVLFSVLIIVVGVITAWYVSHHPETRIIPLVLGILGYTFGSLLGLFLVALFTKTRGNDTGNAIAVACGILAVLFFSNPFDIQQAVGFPEFKLAFPWRVTLGTIVTVLVAVLFPTPRKSPFS